MEEFENRIVDNVAQFTNDYSLGGYIDVNNLSTKRQIIQPDILFKIALRNVCDKLPQYIQPYDVDLLLHNVDKINLKLYKNPECIVVAYIVCKLSGNKISPSVMKSVYNNGEVTKFIKEHQMSMYDVFRYARHIVMFVPEMIPKI